MNFQMAQGHSCGKGTTAQDFRHDKSCHFHGRATESNARTEREDCHSCTQRYFCAFVIASIHCNQLLSARHVLSRQPPSKVVLLYRLQIAISAVSQESSNQQAGKLLKPLMTAVDMVFGSAAALSATFGSKVIFPSTRSKNFFQPYNILKSQL